MLAFTLPQGATVLPPNAKFWALKMLRDAFGAGELSCVTGKQERRRGDGKRVKDMF
jgi:hypothetical protein